MCESTCWQAPSLSSLFLNERWSCAGSVGLTVATVTLGAQHLYCQRKRTHVRTGLDGQRQEPILHISSWVPAEDFMLRVSRSLESFSL